MSNFLFPDIRPIGGCGRFAREMFAPVARFRIRSGISRDRAPDFRGWLQRALRRRGRAVEPVPLDGGGRSGWVNPSVLRRRRGGHKSGSNPFRAWVGALTSLARAARIHRICPRGDSVLGPWCCGCFNRDWLVRFERVRYLPIPSSDTLDHFCAELVGPTNESREVLYPLERYGASLGVSFGWWITRAIVARVKQSLDGPIERVRG